VTVEDAVVARIHELIAESQTLRQGNEHGQVRSEAQAQQCKGWIAAALNSVQLVITDSNSGYRKIAEELALRKWGYVVNEGVGELAQVLANLLKDAQAGLVSSVADRARAEVFDDFLDHAKSYLADGHSDRAGVIAGVVFEDSLRRVCRKHNIDERGINLDQLISQLTTANVLSPTKAKRARVAAHVRTKATHAQWDEFDAPDVRAAIEFTEELVLHHVDG